MQGNLKGQVRLECSAKNNEFYAYDENGFICGTLGCNKERLEELIDRANRTVAAEAELERLTALHDYGVDELNRAEAQVAVLKKALKNISYWWGTGNTEATMLSKMAYDAMAALGGDAK